MPTRQGQTENLSPTALLPYSPTPLFPSLPYSTNSTTTPCFTIFASYCASQLVRRTQPFDSVLPIFDGSGVPWMP